MSIQILCTLMRHQDNFHVALIEKEKTQQRLLTQATFSVAVVMQELHVLTHPYEGRVKYFLVLHFDQYTTLLTQNKGLKASALDKSIHYLVAEQNNFQLYDDWLVYFQSYLHPGYVHVLSASPEKVSEYIQPLGLAMHEFSAIDSYDHALANAVLYAGYGIEPVVVLVFQGAIVRCILIENRRLQSIQETALLEENEQEKHDQLMQRLTYYFKPYEGKPLIFLGLTAPFSLTQLSAPWRFECLAKERYTALLGDEGFASDCLPVIGSGLYHAQ